MMDPFDDSGEVETPARIGQNELFRLVITLILVTAIGAGLLALLVRTKPAPIHIVTPMPTATQDPTATPSPIRVHVSGQVMAPAAYERPPGSIVGDAIRLAGGFSAEANRTIVNLAQPLGRRRPGLRAGRR